jgi:O-antigen/teichoic acid export membrane protein
VSTERTRDAAPGRRQVLLSVTSNWGALVVTSAIGFFLAPFVVHRLGNDAYALWVLLGSLVGYLGLLDLGVRSAVTKYVATYHAAGRHHETSAILSAGLAVFSSAGLVVMALSAAFAWLGLGLFEIPPGLAPIARLVLVLGGVNIAVSLVSGVFGGTIVGLQRLELLNAITISSAIVRAIAIVVALRAGGGLIALAVIQLSVSAASGAASAMISRHLYPELELRAGGWKRSHLRSLMSFGLFSSLIHVAGMISNYSDTILIGFFLPVGQITFFAIAANLIEYSNGLRRGISQVMTPLAGALEGAGRAHAVAEGLLAGSSLGTLVLLPIMVTFILRGSSFIGLWMGPEYAAQGGAVLGVLALGGWGSAGFAVASSTLMGVNKHRGLVPAVVAEAVANVVLSIALIGPFGITGVALGTVVPRLAVTVLFGPWYIQSVIGLPASRYLMGTLIRPSIAMIPFGVASHAIEALWPAGNLLVYFGQVMLALPLAGLGAWFIGIDRARRQAYAGELSQLVKRAGWKRSGAKHQWRNP